MKKYLAAWALVAVASVAFLVMPQSASAANPWTNSRLMDDQIFDNVNSMSEAQIQSFLASKGPCLANYTDVDPNFNGTWSYTGSVSAAHIIYKAAHQWGLNPQVVLSTLQKEESLITGTSCDSWRYNSAMGYGCPDSGGCNPKYVGFTRQVLWGSWQLKFNKERSYGNTAWDGDGDITYVGYMTQGTFKRCTACSTFTYDGNATLDGQVTHLDNGTTASFYTYTPHLGQSLPGIFNGFFGSPIVPTYRWEILGQYAYKDQAMTVGGSPQGMLPGDRVYVGVAVRNTGSATWSNSGPNAVKLGTLQAMDRTSAFCANDWYNGCNRPAAMKQATVGPGETANFEFWMTAPDAPGQYGEHFGLVADGLGWFPDLGLNFAASVVPAVYSWQFQWQYAYKDQTKTAGRSTMGMLPGDRIYVGFQAKNTGNVTWRNSGPNPVNVGMTHPLDRNDAFYDPSWLGYNRPATMKESTVAPGQIATFEFWVNAPSTIGNFPEYFSLVMEHKAWMNDPSMNFYSTVVAPVYSWEMVGQYAYTDQTMTHGKATTGLTAGERVFVGFRAKNTGNVVWRNDGPNPIHIGMTHPLDRNSLFYDPSWLGYNRPAGLKEATIAPGQTGTFEFWLKAPAHSGTYYEYFSLLSEFKTWMNDPGMNFYSTVQ